MARHIGSSLDPRPLYRSIILKTFPGVHDYPELRYTLPNGEEIVYHRYESYGVYEIKSKAKTQISRIVNQHKRDARDGRYSMSYYGPGTVPTLTTFIEEITPQWTTDETTIQTH